MAESMVANPFRTVYDQEKKEIRRVRLDDTILIGDSEEEESIPTRSASVARSGTRNHAGKDAADEYVRHLATRLEKERDAWMAYAKKLEEMVKA